MASSSGFALGFLRRLLCAHSADDRAGVAHRDAPGHLPAPEPEEGRSPCIVARLMGLDAMPAEATHLQPQPLRRSRSASSAEGGLGDGPAAAPPAVRASASLRDKPAYLRPENDMFLLLSFSPDPAERDAEKKAVSFLLAGDGARKQRRSGRRRKLRFGDDDAESPSSSSGRRECNAQAQSSSPVSVLDARDAHEESSTTTTTTSSSLEEVVEHAEPCSATSDEAQFALEQQSSTTKLHTNFDQLDNMAPARSAIHASRCSERGRRNRRMVNKSEVITPDVTSIWQPICRAVEDDLKNMDWLTRDGTNVVAEMESDILDQLICDAKVELVHLCSDAVCALPLPSPVSKKCSGKTSNWKYPCPRNVQARQAIGGY